MIVTYHSPGGRVLPRSVSNPLTGVPSSLLHEHDYQYPWNRDPALAIELLTEDHVSSDGGHPSNLIQNCVSCDDGYLYLLRFVSAYASVQVMSQPNAQHPSGCARRTQVDGSPFIGRWSHLQ